MRLGFFNPLFFYKNFKNCYFLLIYAKIQTIIKNKDIFLLKEKTENTNLMRDLAIIIFSVIIAVFLVKTGVVENLLTSTQEMKILGSFIAGIFFVSIFTAIPATVVFGEIAQTNSIFLVSIIGGIGALIGDIIIFRFIKDKLAEDLIHLLKKTGLKRLITIFRLKFFKWVIPLLGALVVASPLPDELGLAMMGLSKMKTSLFLPLFFLLNSVGILIICLIAKNV